MNACEIDKPTLRAITSGAYRGSYLIYARKSTDEPDSQKNSIAYQKLENLRFATREHLTIASLTARGFCTDGVIAERHSGFKETTDLSFGEGSTVQFRIDRPKFHRLVTLLAGGHFKGVIILCWDRASRNKSDDAILRKLMRTGLDIRFAFAQYDRTSAGELHMDIDGMFAEHHSRVTREKVTLTMRAARDKGLWTHKAPAGYLNTGSMEHKPFDPERAPLITALFRKCSETDWSLADLQRWVIAQGFTMPPSRRRRTSDEILSDDEMDELRRDAKIKHLATVTDIHRILTNPFYIGQVIGNDGAWIPSSCHRALVSRPIFSQVQAKLGRRRTSVHHDKKLDMPFRGFVRHRCGRIYTPYEQKNLIYYGARCDAQTCDDPLRSINLTGVQNFVGSALERLTFNDAELARIDQQTAEEPGLLARRDTVRREEAHRRERKLREDLAYLVSNRLTLLRAGTYTPEALVAEEHRLQHEIVALESAATVTGGKGVFAVEAAQLSELLKMLQRHYDLAEIGEKEQLARRVISELTIGQDMLKVRCASPFRFLEARFFSVSDPNDWLSELMTHPDPLTEAIETLKAIMPDR